MPRKQNKLSQFWHELKRRNVSRVLAVYIAAGFMILELVGMMSEPFGFPEWSLKATFFILLAGLIITLIVSWIYDATPGGLEKTRPSGELEEGEEETAPPSWKNWKIATYVSAVVIIGLILFNIFTRNQISDKLATYGKSIAVLPFINDGLVTEEHFINGTMGTIQNNLCMIKDLRVASRTSVEQYRNASKSIPEIAEDLNVSYILDGSGQKYGDQFRLTLHLMDSYGNQLWSHSYDREIRPINAFFSLQSEIAQLVAREVKAIITPEEKQRMNKVPTVSFEAYDLWSQGMQEVMNATYNQGPGYENIDHRGRAETLFKKALELDSMFAPAYAGLGWICYNHALAEQPSYLDSMLIMANKALLYDDELSDAYHLKGIYYSIFKNGYEKALASVNKALELDPNHDVAYNLRGNLYAEHTGDFVRALKNFEEDLSRNRGSMLPRKLSTLGMVYQNLGFPEISRNFLEQKLVIDGNKADYYMHLLFGAYKDGDFQTMLELEKKIQEINPDFRLGAFFAIDAGLDEAVIEETKEALEANGIQDNVDEYPDQIDYPHPYLLGYGLWLMGEYEMAEHYFQLEIRMHEESLKQNEPYMHSGISIDAAKAYAFTGDTEKACESLEAIQNRYRVVSSTFIAMIKLSPLFDPIRDEPCYKDIMQKMEVTRQEELDRVRRWLEETGRMEALLHAQ
jgi:TolB-like protein